MEEQKSLSRQWNDAIEKAVDDLIDRDKDAKPLSGEAAVDYYKFMKGAVHRALHHIEELNPAFLSLNDNNIVVLLNSLKDIESIECAKGRCEGFKDQADEMISKLEDVERVIKKKTDG